jgi:hypothetical protein
MIPGPIGDAFQNVNPLMADEEAAGTTRRILSELMSIVGQRTRNRVEEVGLGQTVAENTLGRLPSGGRAAQSLATSIMRRENPIRPFFPSTQFVGSGLGPQPGPEGNGSVLHELLVNSPDARNFLRDMEPVINEAGTSRLQSRFRSVRRVWSSWLTVCCTLVDEHPRRYLQWSTLRPIRFN